MNQLPSSAQRTRWIIYVVAGLLLLGSARTFWARHLQARELAQSTPEQAKQYVLTVNPKADKEGKNLELPGSLQGYVEAPIYARSNGYLLHWYKDIGSSVNKGELLAELDTPEVDQQLAQAQANRRQMSANLELAKSTLARWEQLHQRQLVSQQEFEEHKNSFAQAQANLGAADAEVDRLQHLVAYKRIVAPFAGIITKRNVDIGALINPGNGDATKALFVLAQTDRLKLYVAVPQSYAAGISVGQTVEVRQSELPGQVVQGKIEHTAGAIDSSSRTLQIEITLPNSDGKLLPGAFVTVSLANKSGKSLSVPSTALMFRPEGTRVALVDAQGKVSLQAVTVGQDFGNSVEVLAGVSAADQLIMNPSDSLSDGDKVVATLQQPKPPATK